MPHLFGIWLEAIRHIQSFTANLAFEAYLEDVLIRSAVERQFEILGEAARRVSEGFRQIHPQIDWQRIIGLRNIVIHRYDEVNQDVVWAIINSELSPLQTQLELILPPLPDTEIPDSEAT